MLQEVTEIDDICRAQGCLTAQVTVMEVEKAVKSLNRGKAADAMGITAEHFAHAEYAILDTLCLFINELFQSGEVTESMKTGLVTPVFKGRDSVPPPPPGREIITCMRWSVRGVGGAATVLIWSNR